ncbi:integrase catalytic domain-containing protein [Nephila pilipes]|uniref:Integrase catalytic domain-containing protein n=1 Tax=Nephila pilipes TaxID=299642 RepID=A0A8X6NT24_NEPPI|nr:integrase catalytic domain-containing protein [Nephila pilipes]
MHELLNGEEYNDIIDFEKYIKNAHLAMFTYKKKTKKNTKFSSSRLPISDSINNALPPIADDEEAKRLVHGITITTDTYSTYVSILQIHIKNILKSKYGNKDKIIQTHLDYLENLTPTKNPSPSVLYEIYINCNRRLRALDALGENGIYGRILAPKILRAFPRDICRNWVVYFKRENLAEGDITKLMKFLAEEVEEVVAANNIKYLLDSEYSITSSLDKFNVRSKPVTKGKKNSPF